MLRRRQPRNVDASPDQLTERERFTYATRVCAAWGDQLDLSAFGTFPQRQSAAHALRSFVLRALITPTYPQYGPAEGINAFPDSPKYALQPGSPGHLIHIQGTQRRIDAGITDATLSCVGFEWFPVLPDPPVAFALSWPFTQPAWDHTADVGATSGWCPSLYVFTGTKWSRRVSSSLMSTILQSSTP